MTLSQLFAQAVQARLRYSAMQRVTYLQRDGQLQGSADFHLLVLEDGLRRLLPAGEAERIERECEEHFRAQSLKAA